MCRGVCAVPALKGWALLPFAPKEVHAATWFRWQDLGHLLGQLIPLQEQGLLIPGHSGALWAC